MRIQATTTVLSLVTILVGVSIGWARKTESWPLERLLEKADLVVIGQAVSNTPCEDQLKGHNWNAKFHGVTTKFRLLATLKGEADDELQVLHFRLDRNVRWEDGRNW